MVHMVHGDTAATENEVSIDIFDKTPGPRLGSGGWGKVLRVFVRKVPRKKQSKGENPYISCEVIYRLVGLSSIRSGDTCSHTIDLICEVR